MRRRRRRRSKRTMRGLFKIITILFVKKDSNTRKSLTGIFDNRTHLKGNFLTMHSKRKLLELGGGGVVPSYFQAQAITAVFILLYAALIYYTTGDIQLPATGIQQYEFFHQ